MATKAERLYNLVSETRTLSDEERKPETTVESLGLDSLDLVEIVMEVEEEFDIEMPDEDAANKFKTLGDFITFVEENGT